MSLRVKMMQKFLYNQRGAISIFLIIVMVPMLTISGIFIDVSRLNLAKSMAAAAGDLTLNTALTDYDTVLKDMYGLFAVSQDIDDLIDKLESYYKSSIEAGGVAPDDADYIAKALGGLLHGEAGTDDLMKIKVSDFNVTKPTGGNLANPAILKSQIVEFMKYRAPVNLGMSLFEALNSMKNLEKQSKTIENKNEFFNEQTSVLDKLKEAWQNIQRYQYQDSKIGFPTGKYLEDTGNALAKNVNILSGDEQKGGLNYLSVAVKYGYYMDSYKEITATGIKYSSGKNSPFDDIWEFSGGYSKQIKSKITKIDKINAEDILIYLRTAEKSRIALEKILNSTDFDYLDDNIGNTSEALVKYHFVIKYGAIMGNYRSAVAAYLQALQDLKCAYELRDASEDIMIVRDEKSSLIIRRTKEDEEGHSLYGDAAAQIKKIESYAQLDSCFKVFEEYEKRAAACWGDTNGRKAEAVTVKKFYLETVKEFKAYDELLQRKITNLESAINALKTVQTSVSEGGKYNEALEKWNTSATSLGSDAMGQSDKKEIEDLKQILNKDNVSSLIKRLEGAKTSIINIKTQLSLYKIGAFTFVDSNLNGTNPMSTFLNQFANNVETADYLGITKVEIKNNNSLDSTINAIKGKFVKGSFDFTWDEENNPNLAGHGQRNLYTWLYNNYYDENMDYSKGNAASNTKSDKDKALSEATAEVDAIAKSNKNDSVRDSSKAQNNITTYPTDILPTKQWDSVKDELKYTSESGKEVPAGAIETDKDKLMSGGSASLTSLLGSLLTKGFKNLRDDMYISDYIMRNFSYDTFEAERMFKNDPVSLGDELFAESWYDENDKVKDKFKTLAAEAVNLRKIPICPANNYLYGSEVEYIIYGGSDISQSKVGAYGSIFLIRFALNTVYCFTDAELNNVSLATATALFGTPPLTPLIPAAKLAIMLAFSVAESTTDLLTLKKGMSVPLVKNSDTWQIKPSTAGKKIAKKVADTVIDKAIEKGYEVFNEVLEMTDDELTKMIGEGTEKLESLAIAAASSALDNVQAMANKSIDQLTNLCLEVYNERIASTEIRGADGKIDFNKIESLSSEEISKISKSLKEWANSDPSDSAPVKEAKNAAVDYLTENSGKVISEVFEKVKETANAGGDVLAEKLNTLKNTINTKISVLSEKTGSALKGLKDEAIEEIKKAADGGVENLRNTLKETISNKLGTGTDSEQTSSVVSTLISWSYSDYLNLFLIIGLIGNQEKIMLRTADVIQMNVQHLNNEEPWEEVTEEVEYNFLFFFKRTKEQTKLVANESAYMLSKSFTYLELEAELEVKPLFLTMPLLGEYTKDSLDGSTYYLVNYSGMLGY